MSRYFIDTNLAIYSIDKKDPRKHNIAAERIRQLIDNREGVISTQVLMEFASNAMSKVKRSHEEAATVLMYLEQLQVVSMTGSLIRRGVELRQIHQLSFWDACIIAAAEHAGCDVVLSEDFNSGQMYGGVRVENPFA